MTHVAIVIIHYNSDQETLACLDSLNKIENKNIHVSVRVLDNASKIPLQVDTSKYRLPVEILRSDSNLGFTSGNNFVMRQCLQDESVDYILLLNNDTLVDRHFLTHLIECANNHPDAGVVTPKIYFAPGHEYHKESYGDEEKGKVIWFAGGQIDYANFDAFHRGVDEIDRQQFDQDAVTEFATGCCMLIRRSALTQVGMFDARYFLYLEDVDLCLRMRRAGYKIWYCPHAKIWHVNAGSSGGAGSPLHTYYQTRNRLFFFMRYASGRHAQQAEIVPGFLAHLSAKEKQQITPLSAPAHGLRATIMTFVSELRYYTHFVLLAWRLLWSGESAAQAGVIDWFLFRYGKRAVV